MIYHSFLMLQMLLVHPSDTGILGSDLDYLVYLFVLCGSVIKNGPVGSYV